MRNLRRVEWGWCTTFCAQLTRNRGFVARSKRKGFQRHNGGVRKNPQTRTCEEDGCGSLVLARGKCRSHYYSWLNWQDLAECTEPGCDTAIPKNRKFCDEHARHNSQKRRPNVTNPMDKYHAAIRAAGSEPLGPAPTSHGSVRVRCLTCGHESLRVTRQIVAGRQCSECAQRQREATRIAGAGRRAVKELARFGFTPLEDYSGSDEPWELPHDACGRVLSVSIEALRSAAKNGTASGGVHGMLTRKRERTEPGTRG